MNKHQKFAIIFVFLGIAFLAAGLLLHNVVENAIVFGMLLAVVCQGTSFLFALRWYLTSKKK